MLVADFQQVIYFNIFYIFCNTQGMQPCSLAVYKQLGWVSLSDLLLLPLRLHIISVLQFQFDPDPREKIVMN